MRLHKVMKKNRKEHWGPCRIESELVYSICKLLHIEKNYKINILQYMRGDSLRKRGHAWVTCNNKDFFLTPAYRPKTMEKIGENEKYCYWVSVKQGQLKRLQE